MTNSVRKKSEDTISKQDLLLFFEQTLVLSGFFIEETEGLKNELRNFYSFKVKNQSSQFVISANISNISDAYLPNKPFIKRRQVGHLVFETLPKNTKDKVSLLVGIKKIEDEFVLVCWNPFYFVGHSTNRSCYVNESTLEKTLRIGFYVGDDCGTKLYACTRNHFAELLDLFITENAID